MLNILEILNFSLLLNAKLIPNIYLESVKMMEDLIDLIILHRVGQIC